MGKTSSQRTQMAWKVLHTSTRKNKTTVDSSEPFSSRFFPLSRSLWLCHAHRTEYSPTSGLHGLLTFRGAKPYQHTRLPRLNGFLFSDRATRMIQQRTQIATRHGLHDEDKSVLARDHGPVHISIMGLQRRLIASSSRRNALRLIL